MARGQLFRPDLDADKQELTAGLLRHPDGVHATRLKSSDQVVVVDDEGTDGIVEMEIPVGGSG